MTDERRLDVTVLICTFNRATLLAETLRGLARQTCAGLQWEVIVVDNNSTDDTRAVVKAAQDGSPVPLRYVFEPTQGKSVALNTGLRLARGEIIAFTDDDVRVPPGWLDAATDPLRTRADVHYTGGPVRPFWEARPPEWLDPQSNLGGTIAVKDHGPERFIFEDRRKTPLGVNMAVRRELCSAIGGFNPAFGRCGKSLLGQEQADFFYRSRAAGFRGLYVPEMALEHHVPAARLTRRYFRRWWYWKGISQARLHQLHGETELGLKLHSTRQIAGVPLFILGGLVQNAGQGASAALRGAAGATAEHELMVCYALGYIREKIRSRWSASRLVTPAARHRAARIT